MSALVRRAQAGFTLVELLIVVIILTVLAAIIVPQFSSATLDAREATLDSNLARMRSAIELYHAQHNSTYPGKAASSGATCPGGGTAGTGAADSTQALIDQMTMYSNVAGQTCSTTDGTFRFGPYLRKGFPAESVTDNAAIALVTTAGAVTPEGTNPGGWRYSTVNGQIIMNSGNNDSRGRAYSTH